MKINLEHICRLANLELTEEEKKPISLQMEKIVEWVSQLAELETGTEEMYTPVNFNLRMEEDKVAPSLSQEEVMAMAPEKEGDFIKVPKVLTGK